MTGTTIVTKVMLPPLIPIAAMVDNVINEQTGVPLTIVAAIGGACWYINGRFTKLEDAVERVQKNLEERPCQIGHCVKENKE